MAMQILKDTYIPIRAHVPYGRIKETNGNYSNSGTDYAERVREKQAAEKVEKAKKGAKGAEEKEPAKLSEPKDEYISSEKSGQKPTGLYRVGQDENGSRKIFFDDPKAAQTAGKTDLKAEGADDKELKATGAGQGKPEEKCVTNTDKVDREIRKLKEKKQQLERQIQSASGDGKKIRELQKKLAQVENELSQKDNDTYRRQNASVSE